MKFLISAMELDLAKVEYMIKRNSLLKSECFRGWHLAVKKIVQSSSITHRVAGGVESRLTVEPHHLHKDLGYGAIEMNLQLVSSFRFILGKVPFFYHFGMRVRPKSTLETGLAACFM